MTRGPVTAADVASAQAEARRLEAACVDYAARAQAVWAWYEPIATALGFTGDELAGAPTHINQVHGSRGPEIHIVLDLDGARRVGAILGVEPPVPPDGEQLPLL